MKKLIPRIYVALKYSMTATIFAFIIRPWAERQRWWRSSAQWCKKGDGGKPADSSLSLKFSRQLKEPNSLIFIERLPAYVRPPPQHECAHPNAPLEAPLGRTAEKAGQLYLKMCSFGASVHSFLRSVASIGLIAIIGWLLNGDPSPCPLHPFHPQQMWALRTIRF